MAASRGWVPVFVLAVTTLTVCGEDSKCGDSPVNGCLYKPNVCSAVSMECDFSGILPSPIIGQLPPSLQEIRIRNSGEINITGNIFSHIHSLKSIHLSDIRTLRVNENNWSRIEQPEQVTITMDRVSDLSLHSNAFSNWSFPGPKIAIRNVTRCRISSFAFPSTSVFQSVVLQNIQNLTLGSAAFRADVGQLELDVSLGTACRRFSFSGRIRNLSLRSVNITEVGRECLFASDGWDSLAIRSSYLGNIRLHGIFGRITNVLIEDSRLGHVDGHGLNLSTSTFTIHSTEVEELAPDALDVYFKQSASLQRSTINSLRANAFRRLEPRAGATLTIEQVSVGEAEDGSLAFFNQTQVTLLDVELRDPCQCDVDKWALRLVDEDATASTTTDEQQRAARQVVNQVRCTAGKDTMTLAEFHCRSCSSPGGDTARCPSLVSRADGEDWILAVGVGMALLVLVLVGAVVTLVKRRRRRQREEHPPADQLRSNRNTQDVTPGPVYSKVPEYVQPCNCKIPEYVQPYDSEIPEYVQPDERHRSSAFGAPTSTDHPHVLQSEPLYSTVDAPVLPRPPSPLYLEMTPRSSAIQSQSVDMSCDAAAADKQQHLDVNCGARSSGERGQLVYGNLHGQQHL